MAIAQQEVAARNSVEDERVLAWRFEELVRAGYARGTARRLAARREIDLHLAVDLRLAGCPVATALRILL